VAANGSRLERLAYGLMGPLFQSAAQGALPQLFALTAPEATPGGHYGPSQLGGIKGWPKAVPMAPVALDQTLAQRFWQVSEELCAQVLNRRP
jgi:protochlorophyllide reductase